MYFSFAIIFDPLHSPSQMKPPLFQNLESLACDSKFGIGNQEVKVLGQQYVPVDAKRVLFPSFLQDVQEALLAAVIVEQGPTLITTAGNEVRVAHVVMALER